MMGFIVTFTCNYMMYLDPIPFSHFPLLLTPFLFPESPLVPLFPCFVCVCACAYVRECICMCANDFSEGLLTEWATC